MPTYFATGVTATLSTCNLSSSLSTITDLRQGKGQKEDAERITKVMNTGSGLQERPIGDRNHGRSVIQFIGANADLPFYMVEVGETLTEQPQAQKDNSAVSSRDTVIDDTKERTQRPPDGLSGDESSPLTLLGDKPQTLDFPANPLAAGHLSMTEAPQQRQPLAHPSKKALIMDIELTAKSFRDRAASSRLKLSASNGNDLKVEVFVNGELADVNLVSARRTMAQVVENKSVKVRSAGTRIHRQTEKPWLYCKHYAEANGTIQDDAARKTWTSIASKLSQEAQVRGRGRFGDLPPSAGYLLALTSIELPEYLSRVANAGIIDLVITVGEGRKHGPDTPYITGPTRLRDETYTTFSYSHDEEASLFEAANTSLTDLSLHNPTFVESSPEVPLSQCRSNISLIAPDQINDFARRLGIKPKMRTPISAFVTARGTTRKKGRTLGQRLGDLKKMSPEKQTAELETLTLELHTSGLIPATFDNVKAKYHALYPMTASIASFAPAFEQSNNIDPRLLQLHECAKASSTPFEHSLLPELMPQSPQRSPAKKTQASALANSPTRIDVKPQARTGCVPSTPQKRRRTTDYQASPTPASVCEILKIVPGTSALRASPPTQALGGNERVAAEQSHADVLRCWQVPESCKGSCVTFDADEKVQRQIGKARNGDFKEDSLLVGMRFVVT